MKSIRISSCQFCDPDKWIIEGNSKGIYTCDKCHRTIKSILRRKDYHPQRAEILLRHVARGLLSTKAEFMAYRLF